MACVKPDGSLTALGRAVLSAALAPAAPEDVAAAADIPLYRARSVLRELAGLGLLAQDAGERAQATAEGRAKLELTRRMAASGA